MNICHAFFRNYNSNHKKQVILIMVLNGEEWHYLAVTKIFVLSKEIRSTLDCNFYCLNSLLSLRNLKKKLMILWYPLKTLKRWNLVNTKKCLNHHLLFMQILNIWKAIYVDAKLNSEKLPTTKRGDHVPSGFAMFTKSTFQWT